MMNDLRVPWAWYTLPFSLPLLSMGIMGSISITSSPYIRLTMANHENSKLTGALGNASQNTYLPDFPGFDKERPLKILLTTHLSIPSPLVLVFLTPTPPSSSVITTFEPYIPPKCKTISHPRPSTNTDHLPLSSFFGPR